MKYWIFTIACLLLSFGCKHKHDHKHESGHHHEHHAEESDGHDHDHGHHAHSHANEHMNKRDFQELVNRFESAERDAYQQPQKVVELLGDLSDKKVMEIGSGTGYFSFKLVDVGAQVIAADVDDRFQNFIKQKKDSLGINDEQLMLRKLPYDSPELADQEVDMVLMVNTYHHIEDRPNYFSKVRQGLKSDGQVVIIDFFKKELPVGPPLEMKLTAEEVQQELLQAGYSAIDINRELLPYQYVILAK